MCKITLVEIKDPIKDLCLVLLECCDRILEISLLDLVGSRKIHHLDLDQILQNPSRILSTEYMVQCKVLLMVCI